VHNWLQRSAASLIGKLRAYAENLLQDKEISDWSQARYFELRVGRESPGFDLQMRLKVPGPTSIPPDRDKYTVGEALQRFPMLLILGEPGSGKTTALRRLAVHFAESFLEGLGKGDSAKPRLPVYVWLPRFNKISGSTPYERFLAFLRDAFQRIGTNLAEDELRSILERVRLVLLLDGFNEVGHDNLDLVLDALDTFDRNHPDHQRVLTSRPHNFQFWKRDLPVLELLPLEYPHDIEDYLRRYLQGLGQVVKLMGVFRENLQIRQLAVNPLLLFLILVLFEKEQGRLPNSRGRLLDRIARGLLGGWRAEPTDSGLGRRLWEQRKWSLLIHLGYAMKSEGLELPERRAIEIFRTAQTKEDSPVDGPALLDELRQDRILAQTQDPQAVRFWHQTMQEYFAAGYIVHEIGPLFASERTLPRTHRRSMEHKLRSYAVDPRWHETLAIVSGLLSGEDESGASQDDQRPGLFVDCLWRENRLLAAMCLGQLETYPDTRRLTHYVRSLRNRVVVWGFFIPRAVPWLLLAGLITAVLFIPGAWLQPAFFLSRHGLPLTDSFAWLINLAFALGCGLATVSLFFRLCAKGIRELEDFTGDQKIRPSLSALRYISNDDSQRFLRELSQSAEDDFSIGDTTRSTIQTALDLPVRDEGELVLMLASPRTRIQAAEALAERGYQGAILPLLDLIRSGEIDETFYATAVRSLARLAALLPGDDPDRRRVEHALRSAVEQGRIFAERLNAHRGLVQLGRTDVPVPTRGATAWFLRRHSWLIGPALLLFILLLVADRLGLVHWSAAIWK
jgi:hypothetical protein